jgi:arylsulfatase A-like enzyme
MDFMPTLLELAEMDVPESVQGESFAEVLAGGSDRHREFAVSSPHLAVDACPATVTSGRWSAVFWSEAAPAKGVDKAVDGFEKETGLEVEREDLLFDLDRDPGQTNNLVDEHADAMRELREKAIACWESLGTNPETLERWRGT